MKLAETSPQNSTAAATTNSIQKSKESPDEVLERAIEEGRYCVFIGIVHGRVPNQTIEWYRHRTDFPQEDVPKAVHAFQRMMTKPSES